MNFIIFNELNSAAVTSNQIADKMSVFFPLVSPQSTQPETATPKFTFPKEKNPKPPKPKKKKKEKKGTYDFRLFHWLCSDPLSANLFNILSSNVK